MNIRGIDVSQWQGTIDFRKVKNAGISFVIIRAGYGIGGNALIMVTMRDSCMA